MKKAIQKYAPEWPWEKIAAVDRAILEVSVTELLFDPSVPPVVAINEGIELAKEFGNESSSKFINGVLSSLYESIKKSEHGSKN
ncbi:transcription antitermination factor NusB [Candidatus Peregrinibacteria bacterium]|nr:MAG: transcription antitermination factor NusB [Candidatus Peregrinibacteria bacterium]